METPYRKANIRPKGIHGECMKSLLTTEMMELRGSKWGACESPWGFSMENSIGVH